MAAVEVIINVVFYIRPNKAKKNFWFSCPFNFLHSENTQTGRQVIIKRHYDGKIYTHKNSNAR